jgi:hypothetical protein
MFYYSIPVPAIGEGGGSGLGVDEGNVEYIFLCLVDRSILIELQTVTFYSGSYVFICIIYIYILKASVLYLIVFGWYFKLSCKNFIGEVLQPLWWWLRRHQRRPGVAATLKKI